MSRQEDISIMDIDDSCSIPQPSTGIETCVNSKVKATKRKAMKPRSEVWEHFTKFSTSENEIKAKCKYCEKEFYCDPYKNGTASLRTHMNSCRKNPRVIDTNQAQLSLQQGACLTTWKFDQEVCRKALARMIVVDELPFKFVEGDGFKKFMAIACPKFRIPSRWTVARDIVDLYEVERERLKSFFKNSSQRVCLTTDTWTSIQKINYMCLTAHFVDKNWTLQKKIINFCPVTSHKGESISLAIETCLRDWGIDKILTITVDNASSNDVAINNLKRKMANWDSTILKGECIHMRCVAHIINLIVVDGLKDMSESVTRVRDAVKYVKQSPSRLNKFKECVKIEKIESKNSLCLDVSTRWNSTFLMLNVAQKFERAFERFDEQDPCYKLDLQLTKWIDVVNDGGEVVLGADGRPKKDIRTFDGRPTSVDWENVRAFAALLQVFYELTLKVSGSLYVTSNTFAHEISFIHTILKEWKESDDFGVYSMGVKMKKKFDKYWGDPEKMNNLLYVAVVLDPRHKLDFVEFMLLELYGDEMGARVGKTVKQTLLSLYKNYKEMMEPQGSKSKVLSIQQVSDVEQQSASQTDLKRQSILEKYKKQKAQSFGDGNISELDRYLNEMVEEYSENFDILGWWKQNCHRFPILSEVARDVLAIQISTVASESAFSTGGRVLDCFRSSLTPKIVESLVCTQDWLRSCPISINVEETLEDMESLEDHIAKLGLDSSSSTIPVDKS